MFCMKAENSTIFRGEPQYGISGKQPEYQEYVSLRSSVGWYNFSEDQVLRCFQKKVKKVFILKKVLSFFRMNFADRV